MKDQRLVHTVLTGDAEDYEVPRARNNNLYLSRFKGC